MNDAQKRMSPQSIFPTTKSIITLGISYFRGDFPEKPGPEFGRVARYAWGQDYHPVIFDRLDQLMNEWEKLLGEPLAYQKAVDTKPLLERAFASASDLGFVGKNTVLIIPRSKNNFFHVGSWVFLAELLLDHPTDIVVSPSTKEGCGDCTQCLTACPTQAFSKPYTLDARRCISYLTIENKGWIERDMRPHLKDWLFGCDICQEVCPFNAKAVESRWPEFHPSQGTGAWVSLLDILKFSSEKEFQNRWGHTPLSRPKRKGMIRNACVVSGNSEMESLIPILEPLLTDPEPVIRGHALWAMSQLSSPAQNRKRAEKILSQETDAAVTQECRFILN